jgi:hypothetical protein
MCIWNLIIDKNFQVNYIIFRMGQIGSRVIEKNLNKSFSLFELSQHLVIEK